MTETAEAPPATENATKPTKRGTRYQCFPDGDYVVFKRASEADGVPPGSLIPYTGVIPQFKSVEAAKKWLNENGGTIAVDANGVPVEAPLAIVKFLRILDIKPELKPTVELTERPRQKVIVEQ